MFIAPDAGYVRIEVADGKWMKGEDEMLLKLLVKDEINAALAVALTGTIGVVVAKGGAPISPARLLSGVLSNPIPHGRPMRASRTEYDAALGVAA